MSFDSYKFLTDYNIPFRQTGEGCSPEFVNITCPFDCGDRKFHLGIHRENGFGSCWKCQPSYHSIYDIIKRLLPNENTNEILKRYDTSFIIRNQTLKKLNPVKNDKLILIGSDLKPIHRNYLIKRNFDPDYLIEKYKIRGTLLHSSLPYRLIIPIYQNNELVSYQTRSIKNDTPKYINCFPDKEVISIKECLYNIDNCKENYIIVTEGIFKVWRLGENVTCTFSKNFTKKQIKGLLNYDKIFIFFDPDVAGISGAEKLSNILDSLGKKTYVINHSKPPDELSDKEVKEFWNNIKKII